MAGVLQEGVGVGEEGLFATIGAEGAEGGVAVLAGGDEVVGDHAVGRGLVERYPLALGVAVFERADALAEGLAQVTCQRSAPA